MTSTRSPLLHTALFRKQPFNSDDINPQSKNNLTHRSQPIKKKLTDINSQRLRVILVKLLGLFLLLQK